MRVLLASITLLAGMKLAAGCQTPRFRSDHTIPLATYIRVPATAPGTASATARAGLEEATMIAIAVGDLLRPPLQESLADDCKRWGLDMQLSKVDFTFDLPGGEVGKRMYGKLGSSGAAQEGPPTGSDDAFDVEVLVEPGESSSPSVTIGVDARIRYNVADERRGPADMLAALWQRTIAQAFAVALDDFARKHRIALQLHLNSTRTPRAILPATVGTN